MLKKIFIASAALVVSSLTYAYPLTSYDQIVDSLYDGKVVLVDINADKCEAKPGVGQIKRLGVKFNDLAEAEFTSVENKKMRGIATQESGLYGSDKFSLFRNLILVMDNNTVVVLSDLVDPTTYKLQERVKLTCKLSSDKNGAAYATVLNG